MVLTLLLDRAGDVIAPLESETVPADGDWVSVGTARYRVVAVRRGGRWWYATCELGGGSVMGTKGVEAAISWWRRRAQAEAELRVTRVALQVAHRDRDRLRAERDQLAAELAAARQIVAERLHDDLHAALAKALCGGGDRGCPPRVRPDVGTYKPPDFDSK